MLNRIRGIMCEKILKLAHWCAAGVVLIWQWLKGFTTWLFCPSNGCRACKTVRYCYVRKRPDTYLSGADTELWNKVKEEMSRKHNSDLQIFYEMPEGQPAVTFILCPVTSRVASNVAHALKGIVSQKSMVLLLFHSIAPHVSNTPNTKETLGPNYPDLGDIVDVVIWLTGTGGHLRDCPQNKVAVNQICNSLQNQIY